MSNESRSGSIEYRARRRVALKKGLMIHALVFALVNGGLAALWALGGWNDGWAWHATGRLRIFPLWGWGLGLAIHAVVVFVKLQGEGVTERMVEREIAAIKQREGGG